MFNFPYSRSVTEKNKPDINITIPNHIGIILDGNRRWAKAQGKPSFFGHKQGFENVRVVLDHAIARGVKIVTVYAFSTENWNRTQEEVGYLMDLFEDFARREMEELNRRNVKVRVMGQIDRFRPKLKSLLLEMTEKTASNTGLMFNMCLSYGGRDEIVRAVSEIVRAQIPADDITEQTISDHLDSRGIDDPDMIIRTSGEQRLSGFLTWQSVYSELYFTPTPWPAFDEAALDAAIDWYQLRDRRYGK